MRGKLYARLNGEKIVELTEPKDLQEFLEEYHTAQKKKQSIEERMQEYIAVILHELRHCFVNHSDKEWPWNSFDFVHQTAVMMEEAGEAVRAANNMREGKGDQMALYNELAQTAAMCLRIMDQIKEYSVYGDTGH